MPLFVPNDISIRALAVRVAAAGSANTTGRFVLLKPDQNTYLPLGNPYVTHFNDASVDTSSTGVKILTLETEIPITAGFYWIGIRIANASGSLPTVTASTGSNSPVSFGTNALPTTPVFATGTSAPGYFSFDMFSGTSSTWYESFYDITYSDLWVALRTPRIKIQVA